MEYRSIFDNAFGQMITVLNKGEYEHCGQIASDMIRLAVQFELKEEVFMNEIIRDSCDSIEIIHDHYELPKNFKEEFDNLFLNCVEVVISKYKNQESILEQYKALQELQYTITRFKFMSFRRYSYLHKPHEGI